MEFKSLTIWPMVRVANLQKMISSETHTAFSIVLPPYDGEALKKIIHLTFLNTSSVSFSLIFDLSENKEGEKNKEWEECLTLLLCHPFYGKINSEQFIGLMHGKDRSGKIEFKEYLKTVLGSQGFTNFTVPIIDELGNEDDLQKSIAYIQKGNWISFEEFYSIFRNKLINSKTGVSFFVSEDESVAIIESNIKKAIERFESNEAELFNLVTALYRTSAELQEVGVEKSLLEEAYKSKTDYLDFLLKKSRGNGNESDLDFSDITNIKRFYNNEYEILPLWYKQLGHIIKVIMGKRTLRSLFDDNVKKYKD